VVRSLRQELLAPRGEDLEEEEPFPTTSQEGLLEPAEPPASFSLPPQPYLFTRQEMRETPEWGSSDLSKTVTSLLWESCLTPLPLDWESEKGLTSLDRRSLVGFDDSDIDADVDFPDSASDFDGLKDLKGIGCSIRTTSHDSLSRICAALTDPLSAARRIPVPDELAGPWYEDWCPPMTTFPPFLELGEFDDLLKPRPLEGFTGRDRPDWLRVQLHRMDPDTFKPPAFLPVTPEPTPARPSSLSVLRRISDSFLPTLRALPEWAFLRGAGAECPVRSDLVAGWEMTESGPCDDEDPTHLAEEAILEAPASLPELRLAKLTIDSLPPEPQPQPSQVLRGEQVLLADVVPGVGQVSVDRRRGLGLQERPANHLEEYLSLFGKQTPGPPVQVKAGSAQRHWTAEGKRAPYQHEKPVTTVVPPRPREHSPEVTVLINEALLEDVPELPLSLVRSFAVSLVDVSVWLVMDRTSRKLAVSLWGVRAGRAGAPPEPDHRRADGRVRAGAERGLVGRGEPAGGVPRHHLPHPEVPDALGPGHPRGGLGLRAAGRAPPPPDRPHQLPRRGHPHPGRGGADAGLRGR
jgi:hypothetical protein